MTFEDVHREFLDILRGPLSEANREYFRRQGKAVLWGGKWMTERGAWVLRTYILDNEETTKVKGYAYAIVPKDYADDSVYWMIAKNEDGTACWDYSCPMNEVKKAIPIDVLEALLRNAQITLGQGPDILDK